MYPGVPIPGFEIPPSPGFESGVDTPLRDNNIFENMKLNFLQTSDFLPIFRVTIKNIGFSQDPFLVTRFARPWTKE